MLDIMGFVRTGRRARGWKLVFVLGAAAALAACGGGGGGGGGDGGTLNVNVRYDASAFLFRAASIRPTISGLEGHAANCSLASGTLPAGLVLNGDCSLTGTPTQAGTFPFTVRLGASGVSNQLDWHTSVIVFGPSVIYQVPGTMNAGATVDLRPSNNFWTPTPADAVSYSVVGPLPPGLAIDPTSGRIQGTPSTPGSYVFRVAVQVVNAGRTASQVQDQPGNIVDVVVPTILYNRNQAWVGLPFTSTPTLPGGGTYQFSTTGLPAGLTLDAQTGVISGTATTPQTYPTQLAIALTATGSGGGFTTNTTLQLYVDSPVYVYYPGGSAQLGQPFTTGPTLYNNSGDPLAGITYNYALASGTLPAGLTLDPATGTISGTFPATGYSPSSSIPLGIDLTTTLNGISFVKSLSTSIDVR